MCPFLPSSLQSSLSACVPGSEILNEMSSKKKFACHYILLLISVTPINYYLTQGTLYQGTIFQIVKKSSS